MRRIIEAERGLFPHAALIFLIQDSFAIVLFTPRLFENVGGKRREIFEVEETSALVCNARQRQIGPVLAAAQDAVLVVLEQRNFAEIIAGFAERSLADSTVVGLLVVKRSGVFLTPVVPATIEVATDLLKRLAGRIRRVADRTVRVHVEMNRVECSLSLRV